MASGKTEPTPGWGGAALVPARPGATYPLILRGESYAWWRSASGVLLAPTFWLLFGGAVTSAILSAAWWLGHRETDQQEFFAAAHRFEMWEGMLAAHLQIALLIPICLLMVRSWHLVRPGYLWSVSGAPRWRYLAASFGVAVVVFGAYIASRPLFGSPLVWQPQQGFWVFFLVIILTAPLQAAAEEFLFRGYLLQALGSIVANPWFGVLASALVFALFHGTQNIALFLSRFAFGVVMGILVLRTGGIEAAVAAHVVNNLFAFTLAGLTSTISASRTITEVGWAQAFAEVFNYAVIAVLALVVAWRMKVRTTVVDEVRGTAR
ncbi:MAG: CPBP family intramembrane metalloprotease [Propionibacteriaceae bacterium]|nr:CPBP family intramembrane metalloprotease [Propionibacteriaceae bacterium]